MINEFNTSPLRHTSKVNNHHQNAWQKRIEHRPTIEFNLSHGRCLEDGWTTSTAVVAKLASSKIYIKKTKPPPYHHRHHVTTQFCKYRFRYIIIHHHHVGSPNGDSMLYSSPRSGTSPARSSIDLANRKSHHKAAKNILQNLNRTSSSGSFGSSGFMPKPNSFYPSTPPQSSSNLHQSTGVDEVGSGQSPDIPLSHSSAGAANDNGEKIDKSLWTVRALKEHPEIADLYDRIKPINRCIALGQCYAYEETLANDPLIGGDSMIQLILQHLQYEGLLNSRKSLEEEANVKYPDYAFNESRLVTLIRTALKDSEKIFGLTLDERQKDAQQSLEEHLAFLGLLYEEPVEMEDANIYDEPDSNILYVEEKDKEKEQQQAMAAAQNGTSPPAGITQSTSLSGGLGASMTGTPSNPTTPPSHPSPSILTQSGGIPLPNNLSSASLLSSSSSINHMNMNNNNNNNDPSNNIKAIKAASLNKLVILLAPEKNHDLEYTKIFLLTYQSFTTPEKLLQKLIQRYNVPQLAGQTEEEWKKIAIYIQLRVVNVLKNWVKESFSDLNDKMIQTIKAFCENLRHEGNHSHSVRIMTTLNSKIKGGSEEDEDDKKNKVVFTTPAPEPKVPKNIWSQSLDILDVDDEEIARQLTLIDFEMFAAIKPSELLNQSWNKPKLRHRSPNVLALISRFNEISSWTASMILNHDKVKDRARVMAKFVKIGEFLLKQLNNYNTAMAILSGLNQSAIHRLKFTREEMPKAVQQSYTDLQAQLSNAFSYKVYRELLAKANPPLLPYLGVCLTDLTFIEDGNPDFIGNLINFSKRRLVYNVISTVLGSQLSRYNLQPVYQISKLLKNLKPRFDEEDLYRRSLKFESTEEFIGCRSLETVDKDVFNLIGREKKRQTDGLELIASENFTSKAVMEAIGSHFTNKYAEGYPGARYYGGAEVVDELERLCIARALKCFHLDEKEWGANVQPYSGSPANFEVYTALLQPHDRIMGLDLPSGGHLTHGYQTAKKKISASSVYFESMPYQIGADGLIDHQRLQENVHLFKPKLIICGGSAYPREWNYAKFREIADSVGAYLMCDMAHYSGLVAANLLDSPFKYCDVVTTTTHKTLRGPRSGIIFFKKSIPEIENKINFAVFPMLQGGPHENVIAGVAVALLEASQPAFHEYAAQVQKNARTIGENLIAKGYKLVTGGTDNHLVLWDLRPQGITGNKFEKACDAANITVNKNAVHGDASALSPGGVRIGAPALTSRGFKEQDFVKVVEFLDRILKICIDIQTKVGPKLVDFTAALESNQEIKEIKSQVESFSKQFPLPE
ncbi:Ras guanine nucleotide exchange factor [Cavenderia fasciculata]|uniref:Serine hydroxymethyltransferase n=1 Tax=Cavenderia fasciculata TaxID=261658 RepID=F4PYX8_CACFS|nr:Ras guanine nucleotide exchange factor [Cavenderia fasciculata]EGG19007.1 Ras guanine nucleotide exchange factor [Cavenderia fasciculata]|eukprot:XP_004366640.1 Ras guanine nucleotide exchange factor [Cavenderia fasciculata]